MPQEFISTSNNTKVEEIYTLTRTRDNATVFYAPLVGLTAFTNFSLSLNRLFFNEGKTLNIQSSHLNATGEVLLAHNQGVYTIDLEKKSIESVINED